MSDNVIRNKLVEQMCQRVDLDVRYGRNLQVNVLLRELATGRKVPLVELAWAIKYMSDNRDQLVPLPS